MNKIGLFLVLLLILPVTAFTQAGSITAVEGDVEITRNGEPLAYEDVDIGGEVENFDTIRTYSDGSLSFELFTGEASGSEVIVSPDTIFNLDVENISGGAKTSMNLFTGSLALKVKKMTGNNEIEINTEATSMGVRGTIFTVELSPGGEVLVSCEEGRVECKSDKNEKLFAVPGKIIEHIPGKSFREIPVAVSTLKTFRKEWLAEKVEAFKPNALRAIKYYAGRYDEFYDKFNEAYGALIKEREVLEKWYREDEKGRTGSRMETMKEKKQVIKHLFDLRRVNFIFEKIYYRLIELEGYFKQGYGRGFIKPGLTVQIFFNRFNREARDLNRKMAKIRYIMKLYALRNKGSLLNEDFSFGKEKDDFFDKEGFFDE